MIGQEAAKRTLSVAVYNHYKRIRSPVVTDDVELEKSNILLVGPTGTGKTLLAQTLARILDVPFSIADATILTEAGYVGEDVENILVRLLQAADYDVAQAETGILYLDEIDKISRKAANPSITRDVSGEGVQQALLKILEGTVASIPPKGGRKHPEQPLIQLNTRNILFICGGAFDGLEEIISNRIGEKTIGFGAKDDPDEKRNAGALFAEVEPEDLIRYGLIPELVGRLPITCSLSDLDERALYKILTEPKNAITKQYHKLFEMDGAELEFEDTALDEVVRRTVQKGTGARGLRSVLEDIMNDLMYDLPSNPGSHAGRGHERDGRRKVKATASHRREKERIALVSHLSLPAPSEPGSIAPVFYVFAKDCVPGCPLCRSVPPDFVTSIAHPDRLPMEGPAGNCICRPLERG